MTYFKGKRFLTGMVILGSLIFPQAVSEGGGLLDHLGIKTGGSMRIETVNKIDLPKGYHEGLFIRDGKILVCNGRGFRTWVVDPEKEKIVSEIEPFGSFTEGIADDGKDLWLTDWDEKRLYRIKIEGNRIDTDFNVSVAPAHPAGIVHIKDHIYVVTWTRGPKGTKYHLIQFDLNGEMVKKRALQGILEPAHLAWDGEFLWITSWYSQKVFKTDINTLETKGYFTSPAQKTTGIVWQDGHFWITGTYDGLYRVKVLNDRFSDVSG